jgi:hypothetical protein
MYEIATRKAALFVVNESPASVVEKYSRALAAASDGESFSPVTEASQLIPRSDLPALIAALKAETLPATRQEIAAAIGLIGTAWPHAWQKLDADTLNSFVAQLAEDLAEFPAAALLGAIKHLRRTLRFTPSIAELYEAASDQARLCKRPLRLAMDHLREHERRENAERIEAERQEAERAKDQGHLNKLAAMYGEPFASASVDDFRSARAAMFEISFRALQRWHNALTDGEEWVTAGFKVAIVANRVFRLLKDGKIRIGPAGWLIDLLRHKPEEARELVAAIESDTAPADWCQIDETSYSCIAPQLAFGDLIADLERPPDRVSLLVKANTTTPRPGARSRSSKATITTRPKSARSWR